MKKKSKTNYLDQIPVRLDIPWREKENGLVELDFEHKGFFPMIAQKFFKKPRISHIALDQYGSVLWKAIDGNRDVFAIVKMMEAAFPDEVDKMLNRVVTFMTTLQKNHFIKMKS